MIRYMEHNKIYKANKNIHTIKIEVLPKGKEREKNE